MNTPEQAQHQISVDQAKASVERGVALERLRNNPDFQKIVMEGYLKDEAIRLVHALKEPSMKDEASQILLHKEMEAVASLGAHFNYVLQHARHSQEALDDAAKEEEESYREDRQEGIPAEYTA